MEPSAWLLGLKGHYPNAKCFDNVVDLPKIDSKRFAALWLAEGIPFAFTNCPGVFQAARETLAQKLGVSFRNVSLIGSARIGYSLSSTKFGRAYRKGISDLDLFIVDERWFDKLASQATKFSEDFQSERAVPRNPTEAKYWTENVIVNAKNIAESFIDAAKIPTLDRYPAVQQIMNSAFEFGENVNSWSGKKIVTKCTLRTYRDWHSAVDRIGFNLKKALEHK